MQLSNLLNVRPVTSIAAAVALGALVLTARPADAATIQFVAFDLVDTVAGEDVWRYEYFVSGASFTANEGFAIYAEPTLYRSLSVPVVPNAGWDAIVIQPDLVLSSTGAYDALAFVDLASLAGPFRMDFVWLGGPLTPGAQAFDVYRLDQAGLLSVIESGTTVPLASVPEPVSIGLLSLGGLLWGRRHRRAAR